jgi:tetratricopeptide (TPR) repeat protein
MTVLAVLVAGLLAGIAAAGILHPFRRGGASALEPPADPLEEERAGLLRSLGELDDERATGLLPEPEYRALRTETERRAVAVLRALEARDGAGRLAAGLAELRPQPETEGDGAGGRQTRPRRGLPVALVAVAVAAVAVPLLVGAVRSRSAGQPITESTAGAQGPMSFYLDRVRAHPGDVAARLDLAAAYLDRGDLQHAVEQYLDALRISPRNPEARATLGFLLFRAGKPEDGLRAVNLALEVAPDFPLALYYKGVILLDGLHRPADAAAALRTYLAAAPFDLPSRRDDARTLLARAEAAAGATASPTPAP